MTSIFHITTRSEYEAALVERSYVPKGFDRDGFVHCSYVNQLIPVANYNFRGQTGLVLLEIDRAEVGAMVVDENLEGGDRLFPHIYGHLPTSAVVKVHDFPVKEDGTFQLPAILGV
jgi:uncharacterized protein (DUF952 family)